MPELGLDEHGEQILIGWLRTAPSLDDIVLVEEVIDRYAAGDPIGQRWHTTRDVATGDLIVSPRSDVTIVIRSFSDADPECRFTIVGIFSSESEQ